MTVGGKTCRVYQQYISVPAANTVRNILLQVIHNLRCLTEILRIAADCIQKRWIDLAEFRKNDVAHPVTGVVRLKIGVVVPVRYAVALHILPYLRPGYTQKRPDDTPVAHRYAGKALKTGSPGNIEKYCLNAVVQIMGYRQEIESIGVHQFRKESVTELSRSHLRGQRMLRRIGLRIKHSRVHLHTVALAPGLN